MEAEIILGDLIDFVYSIDYLHISLNLKLYQSLGMAGYFYSTQEVGFNVIKIRMILDPFLVFLLLLHLV